MQQSGEFALLPKRRVERSTRSWRWAGTFVAAALLFGLARSVRAEPPTTAPANPQAVERAAVIHRAFRDLADPKPSVREEARSWLLALDRDDLPLLRQEVMRSRPIQRSQIAALREVVSHVYLRGDRYERDRTGRGFMGVMFGLEFEATEPEAGGVEIRHRMCGFCAYRYLQDGDIIRAVVGNPTLVVHSPNDVILAVGAYHAGDTVVLDILRDGRMLRIPIVLDSRPANMSGNEAATAEFLGRRQAEADNYWDENFESLVSEKIS